uniref:AMP-binding_C domain-containing protein n=1 Tax=Heterorhabditis bacteriophora TaxID=37862 RepID=A0A1I7WQU4_HETBA
MIDGENRLFVGGPVEDIININGIMRINIYIYIYIYIAIAKLHDELTAGIVLKENEHLPSVEDLIGILKGCGMDNIPLNRIVLVNCIPRSGTGKLIRSDILFLLKSEDSFVENESSL